MSTDISKSKIPKIIYGTAWKADSTAELVFQALEIGYRALDMPTKHFAEVRVGKALSRLPELGLSRNDIFLQAKLGGIEPHSINDHRCPLELQVEQYVKKSLKLLNTDYLDSILLHNPFSNLKDNIRAWRVLEKLSSAGLVRHLGLSNCTLQFLKEMYDEAAIKPTMIQNRFYRETTYDRELREYCKEKHILYESFWTLTANMDEINSQTVKEIAATHNKTPAQIWFRFCVEAGIAPLTGTTKIEHMKEGLEVLDFNLTKEEFNNIEKLLYN